MDINKLLKEEGNDKLQTVLELNIRIAQKFETKSGEINSILTLPELCVYLICQINVNVCNGGYEHYFYYSGAHTSKTIEAISHLGLDKLEKNFIAAINIFENSILPVNDIERQNLIDNLTDSQKEELDKLSDEYFDISHLEEVFDYAMKHQSQFEL